MADITADQVDSHDHHPTGWRRSGTTEDTKYLKFPNEVRK